MPIQETCQADALIKFSSCNQFVRILIMINLDLLHLIFFLLHYVKINI